MTDALLSKMAFANVYSLPLAAVGAPISETRETLITLAYIASAILFIIGLKGLGKATTARQANRISAVGMLLATLATLAYGGLEWPWIAAGLVIGTAIGAYLARSVEMTGMPELVALFNGFGGLASVLVGWAEFNQRAKEAAVISFGGLPPSMAGHDPTSPEALRLIAETQQKVAMAVQSNPSATGRELMHAVFGNPLDPMVMLPIILAVIIGAVTFTGSIIAWGKLSGKIDGKPRSFPGQNIANAGLLVAVVVLSVLFCLQMADASSPIMTAKYGIFIAILVISLVLGVMAVISIGGADMPVVISLLNSYSGLAACAAGFIIGNPVLIVAGALVGASGIILTIIMCKAMNRSLTNVLFSGFGSAASGGSKKAAGGPQGEARSLSPEDAALVLEAAGSVVIVPGYGMAVAQAQHAVKELGDLLEANGCEVRYAIHPVAGRMPGHMNVLLAEANVPYEQLVEPDDVNPTMETVDVCIVIGANDVVNPAATDDDSSPIYGMPIIEVHRARSCFVLKRSLAAGYAQIENPLFFRDNTRLIFGDAKATVSAMVSEFKEE